MSPWQCNKLGCVPIAMGAIMVMGMVIAFIIAVSNEDVTPYVPFISEAGGNPPEGGIFSIFLYISSTIGIFTMGLRFLIISEYNQDLDTRLRNINWISVFFGILSLMGMVVVAAYPMTVVNVAHNIGAYTLFVASLIYGSFQTWISYKMSPLYSERTTCRIRLTFTILSSVFLILMIIFYPLGENLWYSVPHNHWKGSKIPSDKGFDMILVSSIAEWVMAILFVLYFFTFFGEFRKTCLHITIQLSERESDEEEPELIE